MKREDLFRKEVLAARRNQMYGTVLINTPFRFALFTSGFIVIALLLLLFVVFAEYSEKFTVTGFLDSTKAMVRVYPKVNGVIARAYHKHGDIVHKGEPLFLMDTSYDGLTKEHEIDVNLQSKLRLIEKEITYKKQHVEALKKLIADKYISLMEYNSKKEELMELKNRKSSIKMEVEKYQQSRSYVISSPIDGVLSSVIYKEGQQTDASKPLVKITPLESTLIAQLFIPAKKAGFIEKNSNLILHYDAYPFERFGSYPGKIIAIDQSIMTDDEEDKPFKIGEPYYKATAKLERQTVKIYGKEKNIQNGMTFSAVIVGSRRKIWQWILDPLYAYYGGLFV